MSPYSKRLHQALDERNLCQKDLVELTELSKSSISQYMSGGVMPTEETQERIALALGVPVAWFHDKNPLPQTENSDHLMDSYEKKIKNFPVPQAAKVLGQNPVNVRRTLIQGRVPWGYATQTGEGTYAFHISFRALAEYMRYSYEEMFP